nr:hypothetical protein [Nonomuraea pusilla]
MLRSSRGRSAWVTATRAASASTCSDLATSRMTGSMPVERMASA